MGSAPRLVPVVVFTGFFVLEGFDYGVGILLPFLGKTDTERRRIINTIGPVWDGNEVWILTGGGAIFAAFPHWYATLFSGFYLALFLMLAALIVRGVAFEFRSKDKNPAWRALWDWSIFFGNGSPPSSGAWLSPTCSRAPRSTRRRRSPGACSTCSPLHAPRRSRHPDPLHHPRRDLPEPQEHRPHPRAGGGGHPEGRAGGDGAPAPLRDGHLPLDGRLRPPRRQPRARAATRSGRPPRRRGPHPPGERMGWAFTR